MYHSLINEVYISMIFKKPYCHYGTVFAVALLMIEIFYPALSRVVSEFGISIQSSQWLVTIFLGAAMVAEFIMPMMLTVMSPKRIHQNVWFIGLSANVLSLIVSTYDQLFFARLLLGLSAGGLIILMRIQIEFSEKNITKGFNYAVSAMLGFHAIMLVITPTISAYVVTLFDWRAIHWIAIAGFLWIRPIFNDWPDQIILMNWDWKTYTKSIHDILCYPNQLKQIVLAGFMSSISMCEVIFSMYYLINHFHWTILNVGLYLSVVKLMDIFIRVLLPYRLHDGNVQMIINICLNIFVCAMLTLTHALYLNSIFSYLIGCIMINAVCNALLTVFSINIFLEVAKKVPITGNALLGSLQFGSCFIASAILNMLITFNLVGFILYMSLCIVLIVYLLAPKYRFSLIFA
ncbi:MAG: MFS transporter [Pseudomonadota bacterium]|nr:MFS transporter [Pseudomonadota bacterium]